MAVLAAIGAHAAILGTASVFGADLAGFAVNAAASTLPAKPTPAEIAATCSGDVLLATSARAVMCLAPWRGDVGGCSDELQTSMWIDLSGCRRGSEPIEEVSMVSPRSIQRVTPIDPEKLLEEMAQLTPPPPKPPELQPAQPQTAPPPPPPPPAPARPQQVIENVKPNEEKDPDNARYLAEFSTRVDKESVSRGARNEPMVAKAKPEELKTTTKPPDDPSSQKPPSERPPGANERAPDAPGPLSMRHPGAIAPSQTSETPKTRGTSDGSSKPVASDGFTPQRGDGRVEQRRQDPGELQRGEGGAGGGAPQLPDLSKSKEVLERIAGGGSVDHLDDVNDGDESSLNAKKWVYASFFNRMKRQVAQVWDPVSVVRRTDPTGSHSGVKPRITGVRVTLTLSGALKRVVVTDSSGDSELDNEALRAFKVAAPFPNPPAALAENGYITFAFGFYLENGSSRTSWRLNRQ